MSSNHLTGRKGEAVVGMMHPDGTISQDLSFNLQATWRGRAIVKKASQVTWSYADDPPCDAGVEHQEGPEAVAEKSVADQAAELLNDILHTAATIEAFGNEPNDETYRMLEGVEANGRRASERRQTMRQEHDKARNELISASRTLGSKLFKLLQDNNMPKIFAHNGKQVTVYMAGTVEVTELPKELKAA